MSEHFLDGRVLLHCGDCREVMATLAENSFDALVTDPPYHLTSIVKRMGGENAAPVGYGSDGRYRRVSAGFMGRKWDGGDIAFDPATWRAVLRVLKPGAHAVVFTIPKHIGFVQIAMQEAGFEFRDVIVWAFGSGFPKSHDVSKGIDRAAGAEREVVGPPPYRRGKALQSYSETRKVRWDYQPHPIDIPATDAAREWEGWGTALKPAVELIILARKPLSEGTVAANVLRWGTGAINVDGCRVQLAENEDVEKLKFRSGGTRGFGGGLYQGGTFDSSVWNNVKGRWPANLVHDGSEEMVAAFPDADGGRPITNPQAKSTDNVYRDFPQRSLNGGGRNDSGSAARFFYSAKADADDRLGSRHPTVKPLDLIQWLVRLVTPRGGLLLDPFAGTGTTGEAAFREACRAELIELEAEYQVDIRRRMELVLAGRDERTRESIKAKNLPRDDGPLFDWKGTGEWAR